MRFWEIFARQVLGRYYGIIKEEKKFGYRLITVKKMIPKWAGGQTWGHIIFVLPACVNDKALIVHERKHVEQWTKHGFWFVPLYVFSCIIAGIKYGKSKAYEMSVFEVEAREAADRYNGKRVNPKKG